MIDKIKDIAQQCRNNAEYHQGHEAGYMFDSIASQLEQLTKKPYNQHIFDIAKKIRELPPGIYRSWRGENSIGNLVGLKPGKYHLLLEAFAILKKEGKIHKIKKDGTKSDHGQLWVIEDG